jgi:hypothetical protein
MLEIERRVRIAEIATIVRVVKKRVRVLHKRNG